MTLLEPVEVVEEFEYLGSVVTSVSRIGRSVCRFIRHLRNSFRSLCKTLWYQRSMKQSIKLRMFKGSRVEGVASEVNKKAEEMEKLMTIMRKE